MERRKNQERSMRLILCVESLGFRNDSASVFIFDTSNYCSLRFGNHQSMLFRFAEGSPLRLAVDNSLRGVPSRGGNRVEIG